MHCTITHHMRTRDSDSSAPWLRLSRVRQSTSLGLAQDVDIQLSTSQYSITHPACCQPAMGSWAAVEVIFNSPPAGRRRGVRRFVALHESLHGSPTRTDFSFQYQVLQCWWYSHSNSKSGPLASCTACFMSPLQALLVCLPRTSRGISRLPLPRRVLVGEVAASAIQCISPIGTAPD